jgi:hypothetical protein
MAESRPYRKACPRPPLQGAARANRASQPDRSPILWSRRRRQCVDDHVYKIDSDLSGDMVVSDQELDAIARLLGEELEKILSGAG